MNAHLRVASAFVRLRFPLLLLVLMLFGGIGVTSAQTPQGATLTVLSGQVVVVSPNGAVSQPAASGTTLQVGDQIATIGRSTALVTFFEGTELELGEDTTIILREIQSNGNAVSITVEDVLGYTVSRVNAFVSASSTYRLQSPNGQVVAMVRGSVVKFVQFPNSATLVDADCEKRGCEVLFRNNSVCAGKKFVCGVDEEGNVTNDPNFAGELIDPEQDEDDDDDDDRGGGTIGG